MNAFSLSGRVAMVTGGNGGIGLGIATALAEAGARVALIGRDKAKTDRAAEELRAAGHDVFAHATKLGDAESCAAAVEAVTSAQGEIDILINNAGINIRKRPEEYEEDEVASVLSTNLLVPFHLSVAAYRASMAARGGKIINIGSLFSFVGGAMFAPYAAAKGGLVQLTRSLAIAWAPQDVQVNAILPGWIDTQLTQNARSQLPGLNDRVLAQTPAGRWGRPQEFGAAAVFLAGPGSSFVTGTALPIDGGYSAAI